MIDKPARFGQPYSSEEDEEDEEDAEEQKNKSVWEEDTDPLQCTVSNR